MSSGVLSDNGQKSPRFEEASAYRGFTSLLLVLFHFYTYIGNFALPSRRSRTRSSAGSKSRAGSSPSPVSSSSSRSRAALNAGGDD